MDRRRTAAPARRAVTAAALLAALACVPGVALASAAASSTGRTTVTAATWSVVASTATTYPPTAGQLSTPVQNNAPAYFQVFNTGTVAITGMTYVVTIAAGNASSNVTLTACSQPWAGGSCPGTSSIVGTWSARASPPVGQVTSGTGLASSLVPATSPKAVYVQATAGSMPANGRITVDMSVSSNSPRQIRAPLTTNG